CPISAIGAAMITLSSGVIVTQPPMVFSAPEAKASGRPERSPLKAKANVRPAPPATKPRRESESWSPKIGLFMSGLLGGALDRAHDARIGAAAADVSVHVRDNLLARRILV